MGKADQKKVDSAINTEQDRSNREMNSGIGDTGARVNDLTGRSDAERGQVWGGYSDLSKGGISEEDKARLRNGGSSSGGSGGGGGGGGAVGGPSYLNVFRELQGKEGGFDPTRLGNINKAASQLRDTSGNYGDVNSAIGKLTGTDSTGATAGLLDYAKRGGLDKGDFENINRDTLKEFEQTGGYNDTDKGNIRARSNSGIAATYGSMKDQLDRTRRVSGQMGPGWDAAGFKLARQGAQDIGTNARNTEMDIADRVRTGRMDASTALSSANLGLQGLKNQATLGGYSAANTATAEGGRLGLGRQAQIDDATARAGNLDLDTQMGINQSRLGGASGESSDTLGRMSIGASSSAAAAARADANERFLISQESENKDRGLGGMLSTYGTGPQELEFNQGLQRGYRQDAAGVNSGLINQRIARGYMPGIGSSIRQGIGIAGDIAGIGGSIIGGLPMSRRVAPGTMADDWGNG